MKRRYIYPPPDARSVESKLKMAEHCLETQNKKEYAYNQSYARKSAVLPHMGQTEKERGESDEWALTFILECR